MVLEFKRIDTYDKAAAEAYISAVAPALNGAKAATVRSTTAYFSHILKIRPPAIDPAKVLVDAAVGDPFYAMWHALSMGRPYAEAIQVGTSTAQAAGESFVQSTSRQTGDAMAEAIDRPIRWVRVAEPNSCDWCKERDGTIYASASDGDYGHASCNCDVSPA